MTGSRIGAMKALVAAIVCASSAAKADLTVSSKPTQNVPCSSGTCTATAKKAVLNVGDLTAMLGGSDVTVSTGGIAKDIQISAALSWASTSRLTLDADRSLIVKRLVTVAGSGALTLSTNGGGDDIALEFAKGGSVVFWDLSSSLIINGDAHVLVGSVAQLADAISQDDKGLYALARSYDASGDGTYTHSPIPMLRSHGVVEGLGNTISSLSIHVTGHAAAAGLFSDNGGTVRDLGLSGATVVADGSANNKAGVLMPTNHGLVLDCWSDGSVAAAPGQDNQSDAGGLIGINEGGRVMRSHASVAVTGGYVAGGLVGSNGLAGVVEFSHAAGSVYGGRAGGLVGENISLVNQSFATGDVHGSADYAGGLVGLDAGQTVNAYATGSVMGGADAGGLVGVSGDNVSFSYSTGAVSGATDYIGGLVGIDANQTVIMSYWDLETSGVTDPSQGAGLPANDPGIAGLTTEQLQSGLPDGFDPKIWGQKPKINSGFPYLLAVPPK